MFSKWQMGYNMVVCSIRWDNGTLLMTSLAENVTRMKRYLEEKTMKEEKCNYIIFAIMLKMCIILLYSQYIFHLNLYISLYVRLYLQHFLFKLTFRYKSLTFFIFVLKHLEY